MSAEQAPPTATVMIPAEADRPMFISKAKAAVIVGVSPATIDRLWADGEIEAIKVRGAVNVLVSSLEAYIARQLDEAQARRIARQATRPERRGRWTRPAGEAFPIRALDEVRNAKEERT